jgi:2-polyprenyl-3-methyl-5-hydroxy-6-metoxy-1,4-benzoquinol methylase
MRGVDPGYLFGVLQQSCCAQEVLKHCHRLAVFLQDENSMITHAKSTINGTINVAHYVYGLGITHSNLLLFFFSGMSISWHGSHH